LLDLRGCGRLACRRWVGKWYTSGVKRLVALLLCLVPTACGYGFVRYSGGFEGVETVAIVTPLNDSYDAGVEFMVADALRREFLRRRAPKLVSNPDRADLVISGRVLPIRATSRSFSSVVLALEYELVLDVQLLARRSDGTEVPIDPRATRESERYLASADSEALRKNREEALRQASNVLAGRVYDALYETLAP
jgi:hypothetical protein